MAQCTEQTEWALNPAMLSSKWSLKIMNEENGRVTGKDNKG